MLRIYRRLWQVNWAEQWQYRANLMMYLFYWLVSPIVYLSVWTTIANSQGSVNGLTADDFIAYYMILLIVDQLTSEITIHIFAYKIQDGTLSAELLRPIHPILTNTLMYNLAFKTLTITAFIPVWIVLCFLFQPDFSSVTPQSILISIPAILMGFAINFLFGAAITCLAFWTTRIYSVMEFWGALHLIFAGSFVPLSIMPPLIQKIAQFLPFQLTLYFPVQLILNEMTHQEILRNFALDGFWFIIGLAFLLIVWREGVKRFSAVGA